MVLLLRCLTVLLALWSSGAAHAVTTVSPNGVTVSASGPSTAFLTFQALDPKENSTQAFWCGAVTAGVTGGSVTAVNPCVPGTTYGVLPQRNDLSRISGSGAQRNFADVMTIPGAVARRAYQDAQAGKSSGFYYVRQFTGGAGGDRWVVVACRLAGSGAAGPLALTGVRVAFQTATGEATIVNVARGESVPRFGATLSYNGSGTLRGRWEAVLPGDTIPTHQDLLSEASLPPEQRSLQRRYTLVERFEAPLSPGGRTYLPGPDRSRVPVHTDGTHRLLLRIEGSEGVAGFPMPVLQYHVGAAESLAGLRRPIASVPAGGVTQLLPEDAAALGPSRPLRLSWREAPGAAVYRVEFADEKEILFSAVVEAGTTQYDAPPFLRGRPEKSIRWRVLSLGRGSEVTGASGFRVLRFE